MILIETYSIDINLPNRMSLGYITESTIKNHPELWETDYRGVWCKWSINLKQPGIIYIPFDIEIGRQ